MGTRRPAEKRWGTVSFEARRKANQVEQKNLRAPAADVECAQIPPEAVLDEGERGRGRERCAPDWGRM